ncbi:TPA: hypothetical protein DEF17_06960 [bacterium]|nr:MAG: hypothetical protein AUJ18_10450 [Candidatus Hydrogenedentes bacterium CG1_02_42_14]PIU47048.1 MAG: hypothetical protein COS94_08485 [Candidatus Hydrogenedentes bacterium CG07_land_8_20_14_0_80_42_17]HBW47656.1 hypothetical protein [bacterium]
MNNFLPWGLSAWLPKDCERLRRYESVLRNLFIAAGAGEIATPAFEYAETLENGFGNPEKFFRFFDTDGNVLALRPELTTPAARLFATALNKLPRPVKVFYLGQVFRQEEIHSGRFREFRQAGFECYGGNSPDADVAIIKLAIEALKQLNCNDCILEIGHVGIVKDILSECGIHGSKRKDIMQCVEKKDRATLEELSSPQIIKELLMLPRDENFFPSAKDLLKGKTALNPLLNLEKIYERVSVLSDEFKIFLEPAATRRIDYYTGIVFEGLLEKMPRPVLSGGRYDTLVGQFGESVPATGFSIELEALLRLSEV